MTNLPIPTARDMLRALANRLSTDGHGDYAQEVLAIEAGMYRRAPVAPRAPITSQPVTAAMVRRVRSLKATWPGMSNQMLAEKVGTNAGRVSEIFHGEWDHLLGGGR